MDTIVNLWKNVLELIKPEFASSMVSYTTWIETITPVCIENNILYIEVPYEYSLEIVNSRYRDLIKNSVKFLTGEDIELIVSLLGQSPIKKTFSSPAPIPDSTLNKNYLFENFVIGKSNEFAHATAVAIAEGKGSAYNPFFIYGGVGLGKTHLMHAIGNYILQKDPTKKILYVSSEQFTIDMINSIRNDKNQEFRDKYRTVDMLLIDDIQFISDKEATQEEFFHTFNELYQNDKHIIITSDRPPKDLPTFMERLKTRFQQGVVVDIIPPDYETRIAILRKKAYQLSVDIPDDVYEFVASNIKSNIRELEGAIKKILLYHKLAKKEINVELAKKALEDIITEKKKKITPQLVISTVEKHFNLKENDLKSKSKSKNIAFPRQIAMYVLNEYTDLTYKQIGDAFGGLDHTTVLYGCNKIKSSIDADSAIESAVNDIIKDIKN
ncbi:MAG: chromosomal replication initiator protein DnaA [Clostridia bacterium]|nr:chromosomal replication initiator protein DnaA [Clostridia bacterium]